MPRTSIGSANQIHSITAAPATYSAQGCSVGKIRFNSPQQSDTDASIAVSSAAAALRDALGTSAGLVGK